MRKHLSRDACPLTPNPSPARGEGDRRASISGQIAGGGLTTSLGFALLEESQ